MKATSLNISELPHQSGSRRIKRISVRDSIYKVFGESQSLASRNFRSEVRRIHEKFCRHIEGTAILRCVISKISVMEVGSVRRANPNLSQWPEIDKSSLVQGMTMHTPYAGNQRNICGGCARAVFDLIAPNEAFCFDIPQDFVYGTRNKRAIECIYCITHHAVRWTDARYIADMSQQTIVDL